MSSGNGHKGINYNVAGVGICFLNRGADALIDMLLIIPRWWKGGMKARKQMMKNMKKPIFVMPGKGKVTVVCRGYQVSAILP